MTEQIHTCNYECTNPACIKTQRDWLILKFFEESNKWIGLTAEEAAECWSTSAVETWRAIEAKLKEKNS